MRRIVLAAVAVVTLVACGKSDKHATVSTTTTAPFTSTVISTPEKQAQVRLRKIDFETHDGFERVVFRFAPGLTTIGYQVSAAQPPFVQDGSGKSVAVSGAKFVAVRIVGVAHNEDGTVSYPDGQRVKGKGAVTEVVRTGDFEGIVNFVIGSNGTGEYRAAMLENPLRLVVDIASA